MEADDFVDPIIQEIRDIRAKSSEELMRDPERARRECHERVMALATDIVRVGPHCYTANYSFPDRRTPEARKEIEDDLARHFAELDELVRERRERLARARAEGVQIEYERPSGIRESC